MAGKFLLGTNVIVALFSGDKHVQAEVFAPSTALGELYYGARKSAHAAENLARIERFAAAPQILSCNSMTAWIYGEFEDLLRLKGRPVPENDIWIVAISLQTA
jgi:tRNA(fMet)-specific endonuclease VapC